MLAACRRPQSRSVRRRGAQHQSRDSNSVRRRVGGERAQTISLEEQTQKHSCGGVIAAPRSFSSTGIPSRMWAASRRGTLFADLPVSHAAKSCPRSLTSSSPASWTASRWSRSSIPCSTRAEDRRPREDPARFDAWRHSCAFSRMVASCSGVRTAAMLSSSPERFVASLCSLPESSFAPGLTAWFLPAAAVQRLMKPEPVNPLSPSRTSRGARAVTEAHRQHRQTPATEPASPGESAIREKALEILRRR